MGTSHRRWRGYEAIDGACARREREPQGGRGGAHLKHDPLHYFGFICIVSSVQASSRATAAPTVSMACNRVAHNGEQVYAALSSPNDILINSQHATFWSFSILHPRIGSSILFFAFLKRACLKLVHPRESELSHSYCFTRPPTTTVAAIVETRLKCAASAMMTWISETMTMG